MTHVLINGENNTSVSVFDRGLQYGDGLFETMAVHNGIIPLWNSHWERLLYGCKQLSLSVPDKATIETEITLLIKAENANQFIIKLIITRGEGERGYLYPKHQNTTRILSSHPWPDYPESHQEKGVAVRYCETRLAENKKLAGLKHLNRLEQILARNEWGTDEFQEGLMLSQDGFIVDGTMSNIFAVKDNMVFTPALTSCGVSGVMRKTIIDLSKTYGYPVHEKTFTKTELEQSDELFLTNSLFGIWPIKIIAKKRFAKVGTVTKLLQTELQNLISK